MFFHLFLGGIPLALEDRVSAWNANAEAVLHVIPGEQPELKHGLEEQPAESLLLHLIIPASRVAYNIAHEDSMSLRIPKVRKPVQSGNSVEDEFLFRKDDYPGRQAIIFHYENAQPHGP